MRTITYALAVLVSGTVIVVASRSAVSAGQGTAIVRLQTTTPGSAQTGHVNVAGTAVFDRVGVGDSTPAAPFTVGNGDKFQVYGDGSVRFNDPNAALTFPAVAGASSPMIRMFASGTGNANRMVLAHSASFPDWGMQYADVGDKFGFVKNGTSFFDINLLNEQLQIGRSDLNNVAIATGVGGTVTFMPAGSAMKITGSPSAVTFNNGSEGINANGGSRPIYGTTSAWDPNSSNVACVIGDHASSTVGIGVIGQAGSVGVYGLTSEGYAVYGLANFGRGVYGYTSSGYGVYGRADNAAGYAGYFQGKTHVAGTLSKSGGAFKIDDPRDPEGKYLMHSFVESPDMMNVYNGVTTTDGQGYSTVQLPSYFKTINRDFRYQLTVIGGQGFALAKIEREIDGNQFVIRTNEPSVKVSWQVTGIRQDPWAEANRIIPETEKPDSERGTYLNPEVYGQPESKRLGHEGKNAPTYGRFGK